MNSDLTQLFTNSVQSMMWVILLIKVILNLIFAAAVARDAGLIIKQGRTTWLVSGLTWAFATLIGGVFVAAIYWFIHYSNIIRNYNKA